MSESFLPPATAAMVNALSLRGFATVLALRGRSVTFEYHDTATGTDVERAPQTVLVTFDGERARSDGGETVAAAWSEGTIEKEGTLIAAPEDAFLIGAQPAHVTQAPVDRDGIATARFALGVGRRR
jgi:hypothetical protein